MLKLNDTNIFVGYIKELLHDFNLPTIKIYNEKETYIEGEYYIKNGNIYKLSLDASTSQLKEILIKSYKYNEQIPNITRNLVIDNNLYDSYTHNYLGEYLRFHRDFLGVDLMSMYNCFCGDTPTTLDIECSKTINNVVVSERFNSNDPSYSIYMVPVKFGKKYMISIDCSSKVSCVCDFYSDRYIEYKNIFVKQDAFRLQSYKIFNGLKFNKPFINSSYTKDNKQYYKQVAFLYEVPNYTDSLFINYEQNLKLFIKVPKSCTSSIVVLEGDYSKGCEVCLDDDTSMNEISHLPYQYHEYALTTESDSVKVDTTMTEGYVTRPCLVQLNSQQFCLISDRLIEYLTGNAISTTSSYSDIKKLQERLHDIKYSVKQNEGEDDLLYRYLPSRGHEGMWNENIRKSIYHYVSTHKINLNNYDIISYCDKDIEHKLGGIE